MDNNVEIPFSRPHHIFETEIAGIKNKLARLCSCSVDEIIETFEPNRGYIFYYRNTKNVNVPIADLLWDRNHYRGVVAYQKIISEINAELTMERESKREQSAVRREEREQRREVERKRKLKLQKYVNFGKKIAIPLVIFVVLAAGAKIGFDIIEEAREKDAPVVTVEENINTIHSANDIILSEWMDYAMGEVTDKSEASQWEQVRYQAESIKTSFYIPTAAAYYNYLDRVDANLPDELDGELKEKYHTDFRDNAVAFNEELINKGYNSAVFSKTPYANAIVVDSYDNVVTNETENGAIYDTNGELIVDSDDYSIYVRASEIENNDYNLSNLPSDARIINGEAYVLISHLYDFVQEEAVSKK